MDELTATSKPFVPQGLTNPVYTNINPSAPPFIPTQVFSSTISGILPEKKSKKGGKKAKANGGPPGRVKGPSSGEQKKKTGGDVRRREKVNREDEVRTLTTQLREKEVLLQQMEALKAQESQAQSEALAKKVEQEVTQKLFKASVLSNMYKESLAIPEPPVMKAKKAPSKSSKPSKSVPSSRRGAKTEVDPQNNPPRPTSDRKANGGSGGGLLRKPASQLGIAGKEFTANSRSQRQSHQKEALNGILKVKRELAPEELRDNEFSQIAKERAAVDRRIAALELETKDILNKIRQSKPLIQDFCLLGISNGAPVEFVDNCRILREHFSTKLLQETLCDSDNSADTDTATPRSSVYWARKFCDLSCKPVGLIRQVLDKAEKKGGIDDTSINQIRHVFLAELRFAVEKMMSVVKPLQDILFKELCRVNVACAEMSPLNSLIDTPLPSSCREKTLRSALQLLYIEISELGRQQLKYFRFEDGDASATDYDLRADMEAQVVLYRQRSLEVAPHNGAPYEAMSRLAFETVLNENGKGHRKRDQFMGAYYLVRGMGVESPLLAAREALLDIFEDQKSVSDQLENVTALSRLTLDEHIRRFKVHFLAAVGVAYSRTGADRLGYHLTKARRHVGTMLQLVSTSQLCDQNRGKKGSFTSFDQKAFQKQGGDEIGLGLDLIQLAQCREVDQSLCQSLLITLSLIESVGSAQDIHGINVDTKWAAAYSNWIEQKAEDEEWTLEDHISHIDREDRCATEKRYVAQRLHKIQSIPGLLDLLRLLVGLIASLLSTESIGNVLDSERQNGKLSLKSSKGNVPIVISPRILTTTRMVSLFFEWLDSHPDYHTAITTLDAVGWESVEAELPRLVSSLRSMTDTSSGAPSRVTKDDFDLLGFVPLRESIEKNTIAIRQLEITVLRTGTSSLENTAEREDGGESSHIESLDALSSYISSNLISFEEQTVAWVCQYATRCCGVIRELCEQPVHFGEFTFFVNTNSGKREVVLPSAEGSTPPAMTVIEYSPESSARISGFNNVLGKSQNLGTRQTNFVLSKEAFMKGAVVNDVTDDLEDVNAVDNTEEGNCEEGESDEESCEGGSNVGDLSSLSDESNHFDVVDGQGVVVEVDDDDLDLTNLVLDDIDETHVAPPPGFMPLDTSETQIGGSDSSTECVDQDFAAMCAALLTVPLTAEPHSKSTDVPSQQDETTNEMPKGGRGLLRVKVPPSAESSSLIADKDTRRSGHAKLHSYGNNTTQKKPMTSSVYSSMRLNSDGDIPLIVVDAPNVAMRHGLNSKFSCNGIKLALNFFHSAGHKVIAFLPDYYLNFERVGELRRLAKLNIGEVRASQLPDDVEVLQQLVEQGFVIGTPSQDYDDSYCITYAQRRGGYIISNDMYRDHVKRIENKVPREEARKWIKSHVISYTFVGDEFLPNPDASIFAR